jgi:hypothetical protein
MFPLEDNIPNDRFPPAFDVPFITLIELPFTLFARRLRRAPAAALPVH